MSNDRSPIERAADVAGRHLGAFQATAKKIALDLYAEHLLPDADTERLVRLGRAVEATGRKPWRDPMSPAADGWNDCLDAIYAEAGVTTEGDGG